MFNPYVYGDIHQMLSNSEPFFIPRDTAYFPETSTRCVEVPLVFSAINHENKILDIGISLADPVYFFGLLCLVSSGAELHGLDIVPIHKVFNRFIDFGPGLMHKIVFHHGDIRNDSDISQESFDLILCVSVLEHIGFDVYADRNDTVFERPLNNYHSLPDFHAWNEDIQALNSMLEIVRPGGRILLTVPFGAGGVFTSKDSKNRYATHLEYNKEKWLAVKSALSIPVKTHERVFQMKPGTGWREVTLDTHFPRTIPSDSHIDQGLLFADIVCS